MKQSKRQHVINVENAQKAGDAAMARFMDVSKEVACMDVHVGLAWEIYGRVLYGKLVAYLDALGRTPSHFRGLQDYYVQKIRLIAGKLDEYAGYLENAYKEEN